MTTPTSQTDTDMKREIAAAAAWWAEQLPAPAGPLAGQVGVGPDDAMGSPMAQGLFSLLAEKEAATVTPERVDAFRAALVEYLESVADEAPYRRTLSVDYGPDVALGEALEAAGLNRHSSTLLPLKTAMWVNPGSVRVSKGYRAPVEDVPLWLGGEAA